MVSSLEITFWLQETELYELNIIIFDAYIIAEVLWEWDMSS